MAIKTYGTMAVDWEQRIDFDRLRRERLDRVKALLRKSEMGALLCFDMNNVRYITATHIGTWAQDKANRFTLLPQDDEPILWTLGLPRNIINSTLPGWERNARARAFLFCAAPCLPRWGAPKMWQIRSGLNSKNAVWKRSLLAWILPNCPFCSNYRKKD